MPIDRNIVTKEFKRYIWPLCRIHGFSKINGRTMWRFREGAIDVINLQGDRWNGGPGESQRFFMNLGVYLTGIERPWTRRERGRPIPTESECDMRAALRRPTMPGAWGGDWTVDGDGENIEDVFTSVQEALEHHGFPWFRKFWDADQTLQYLMETEGDGEVGLGRLGSPHRDWTTGLYALSLGRWDLAEHYLSKSEASFASSPYGTENDAYAMVAAGLSKAREANMTV